MPHLLHGPQFWGIGTQTLMYCTGCATTVWLLNSVEKFSCVEKAGL